MNRQREIWAVMAGGAFLVLALVVGTLAEAAPKPSQSGISAENAWSRYNQIAERPASAYVTLRNRGKQADALVGASSTWAGRIELHGHDMTGGVMRMPKVSAIALAPGSTVQLSPGGFHLMLYDLKTKPKLGSSVPLTLTFKSGASLTVPMVVQNIASNGPKPMMEMNDHIGHDMKITNQ